METIEQVYLEAVLAVLAYVDNLTPDMTGQILADKIEDRITEPLATTIGARFEVLAVKDDPSSSYQGVVFRDKTDNTIYLANQGVEKGCRLFQA